MKHPATNRADIALRLEPRRCLAKIAFFTRRAVARLTVQMSPDADRGHE